jgi:hypothetical protein
MKFASIVAVAALGLILIPSVASANRGSGGTIQQAGINPASTADGISDVPMRVAQTATKKRCPGGRYMGRCIQ